MGVAVLALALISNTALSQSSASLPFADGFEAGTLSEHWSTYTTANGRIQITTVNAPKTGLSHLTMDSSVDTSYSLNEVILTIDAAGHSSVILTFWHKEFGDEDHSMSESFSGHENSDGVAISVDGVNWYKVQGLVGADGISGTYTQLVAHIDQTMTTNALIYSSDFKIKFQQYDNYGISTDGFAFDDISIVSTPLLLGAAITPASVGISAVTRSSTNDLAISWAPVTFDCHGLPLIITNYNIYCSTSSVFAPDLFGHADLLQSVNGTTFVHSNALLSTTSYYYYVTAVASGNVESVVATDMVSKLSYPLACLTGETAFSWVNIPYDCEWTNASLLATDLGPIDKLYSLNDTNQLFDVWDHLMSTGRNFSIAPGDAIGVEVSSNVLLHTFGQHDFNVTLSNSYNSNAWNQHWVSVPANAIYRRASDLSASVTGSTKIAFYDSESEGFKSWFLLGTNWAGTDFDLMPENGTLISLNTNSIWRPEMPYPAVAVYLESPAGFAGISSMSASGVVTDVESDIVEYAWDEEGDGVFDRGSGLPMLSTSEMITNVGTWYPSLRVKDSHGFYGFGYARYDVLGMNLSFSNQSFRAELNQTNVINYSSSTGGYFSTYIYDINTNLVRTIEANVFHSNGTGQVFWDGKNTSSEFVSTGVYYVVVNQNYKGSDIIYDPSALLMGFNLTPALTNISIPETFDPYAGGQFPVEYFLPSAARVTIHIRNQAKQIISTVCSNAFRSAGDRVDYWDGRLSDGSMLGPDDLFHVSISAIGLGDNAIIVDDGLPPIDGLASSATRFIPAANPYGLNTNSVRLSYQLSADADVRIIIRRADGREVQNALEPGKTVGSNESIWSGTDSGGLLVPAGVYSLTLSSESGGVNGDPSTLWAEVYY